MRPADDKIFRLATQNRLLAADMFAELSPQQWSMPSLCEGWSVREIAAHLVQPLEADLRLTTVLSIIARNRGDLDRYINESTREVAERPTAQIVADLRRQASARVTPPFVGPGGQLADTCIHLRDAAQPLGLRTSPSLTSWRGALDFLMSPQGSRGFLPRGRTSGLRFAATDQYWSAGTGEKVRGPSEALAMAMSGRTVALEQLSGPGVEILARRIT